MQASVFEPMDRAVAETVLKETKHVLDQLGIVFFHAPWNLSWGSERRLPDNLGR
jgi:hypothetical protein